jgi:hypothetical protein
MFKYLLKRLKCGCKCKQCKIVIDPFTILYHLMKLFELQKCHAFELLCPGFIPSLSGNCDAQYIMLAVDSVVKYHA